MTYDPTRTTRDGLAAAIEEAGYEVPRSHVTDTRPSLGTSRADDLERAEDEERRSIRRDLSLAVLLGLPVLVLAHGTIPFADTWSGRTLQLVLSTLLVFGPGARFLRLAWAAAKHRTSDMNTLVSLGILSAYGLSAVAVLFPHLFAHAEHGVLPHLYFEAAAAILGFVLFGKLLETRARRKLSDAVRGLASLVPPTACVVRGGVELDVDVAALVPGDLVRVRPGERIPTDGEVESGASA